MKIPPLVLNKLDSEPGIQQWIMLFTLHCIIDFFLAKKKNVCLLIMKKHSIVLKERFCGKNFWTLVLTAVY